MKRKLLCGLWALISACALSNAQEFKLNPSGYFQNGGVDVMAFDDIYPEGHQGGVCIIMHGNRVATNGDIRLEQTPGQWQPVPAQRSRKVDVSANAIVANLSYPDSSRHLTGFNPMIYPDLQFNYTVTVRGVGGSVEITVDLDRPIPEEFIGKVGFNFELFPGSLFGKPWIMDDQTGIFPQQPNGPAISIPSNHRHTGNYLPESVNEDKKADILQLVGSGYSPIVADDLIAEPYAAGYSFTIRPDDPYNRFTIKSDSEMLKLYDGRMNHNNGWFVVRTDIPAGVTKGAIKWTITPNTVKDWLYKPVVQTSQLGYHPAQPKLAVIELDKRDQPQVKAELYSVTPQGEKLVKTIDLKSWGAFLRYNYLKADFSDIKEEGLYLIRYGASVSSVFRIAKNIYDRGVWQPVLEYFLPVQMCHMRVNEKYRVWHNFCHLDDARMAPALNHIDGYSQGTSTLTRFNPGDIVPGLNIGGWHDAGDFDLRVESQSGEAYILALAYESFGQKYDATAIDFHTRITEIHQPDGKPDMLQQVENGALRLFITTGDARYKNYLLKERAYIQEHIKDLGWIIARADQQIGNSDFSSAIRKSLQNLSAEFEKQRTETPYGIPYRPHIWGAGWDIQAFGFRQYFLSKSYPDLFDADYVFNALNFVLGCHPGSNTASFASGVGAKSATVGYGLNRADWSYIPGGVISGTALIRPDFPELLTFPYLWQQTEYVLGGGSSHYMFLVLAAQQLLNK